jgi:hypothetical protein
MENQSPDENMTIQEALDFVDQEVSGTTFYPGKRGLIVAAAVLAEEVRKLRAQLGTSQN